MLLIGLTGSIATGKSTVSTLLTSPPYSLPLIDADVLARKVVDPGTRSHHRIVEYFGPSTPDLLLPAEPPYREGDRQQQQASSSISNSNRPLNRAALGRRVFGDTPEKKRDRAALNAIIHPAVRWEMYRALLYYYVRGYWAVVLDVPLLFESRLDLICGCVVVVAVREPETQVRRLLERDRGQGGDLTEGEAWGRVGSQWDVREKAERCLVRNQGVWGPEEASRGLVVWNDGEKGELGEEVGRVVREVKRGSPGWWSWVCLLVPVVGAIAGLWQVMRNLWDGWRRERRRRTRN